MRRKGVIPSRASEDADIGQGGRKFGRERVIAAARGAKIGGRVGASKVAPALKRAFLRGGGSGDSGVKNDGTAPDSVAANHLVKAQDGLAALYKPLNDPIDRATLQQFGFALGPHPGNMAWQPVGALRAGVVLPGDEILDRLGANAEFDQMQGHMHSPELRHIS